MARVFAAAVTLAVFVTSGTSVSTKTSNYFVTPEAPDHNNEVVAKLLANVNSLRNPGEAYAVFDWDNTCMFGDVSATSMFYQVDNLNFRFSPDEFESIFALGYNASSSSDTCLPNGTSSVIGQDANGDDVTLVAALADTAKDYKALYDAYIAPTYNLTNVMDGGNEYSECSLTNAMMVYPRLLVGMTEDEIRTSIRASIRWNLAESLDSFTYRSTGDLVVEGSYSKGLRVFSGQEATMRALREAGVEVYIISASPELFAEEAADLLGLGYLVPKTNVYGGRFTTDAAGKFSGKLQEDYPTTWGPGKATVVKSILMQIHEGAAPIYASGDSDGDCEMFSTVRDGIVDTNNRLMDNSTCIYSFYEKACLYFGTTEPITNNAYLLQGQDKSIGTWITSGFTTEDGANYSSGVATNDGCTVYKFLDKLCTPHHFEGNPAKTFCQSERQRETRAITLVLPCHSLPTMAPRTTRASTAAKRRATSKNAASTRVSHRQEAAEEEEYKAEDPDSDHVVEQHTRNQTPQSNRIRSVTASDDIFSGNYLSQAGRNSSALSKKLKEMWQTLQKISSKLQQREDGVLDVHATHKLHLVAAELLQNKLLQHQDRLVRSLVACCLVEIMRVSVPDSPFGSNEDLYRVFKLFIEQIRALSTEQTTTSRDLHHFHVLESLATVKTCLLVVGLDFTTEENEARVMVQLFEALFDTLREDHSAKMENLMLSIMVACIEESDESGSYGKGTDSTTSELLQNPLSNFFSNILVDGPGSHKSSELKEHVYTLIYEVHKINPSLLLYVLPNVCLQLQVDEVATRSDAIALMGKLFASSHADYGHQYMKNFRDFLGRFRDASKEIRLQIIQVSVPIWEKKTDLADLLEKEFILRLSDPEWEVRQLVVHELCDFAANSLDLISEECLRAVGERMKDKKVALRKETMTGLSQVFSTHISSYWDEEDEEERLLSLNHRNIPADHSKKLGWIPDYVLKCYALSKLLERLSKWKDHSVFKHLGELCDFSNTQREARKARDQLVRSVGSKTPLGEFLKKLCRKLALLTMSQASVAVLLDFLVLKDGRPSRENRSIVDLLVMASGELPELFAPFIREKITAVLVESSEGLSDEEDEDEAVPKDPRVILGALHVLANYSRHWAATIGLGDDAVIEDDDCNTPSAELFEQLQKFCLGDGDVEAQNFNSAKESRAAELAAFTIAHYYANVETTTQLISKLCSKAKPKHSGALPALQSLEVFTKRCSHVFSQDRDLFSRLWTSLLDDVIGKGEEAPTPGTPGSKERTPKGSRPAAAKLAEVRCSAIKVAVNLLVYCWSTAFQEDASKLIKLLFVILRSDGKTYASTPAQTAAFRATASCGLMKIMRNRQLESTISVSEWHLLGFTLQDSNEDVRRKFLKKLTAHLMKQPVQHPHKYISYLALAATDANTSVKKSARNLLKIAVERMRRLFDAASSRESMVSPGQDASMSALMVPEYALPYVIHLLAHHPSFPVKLVERTPTVMVLNSALWTDQLAYLSFFLDGLVSTNAAAANNIAFLLQILTKLSQCHDVISPNDINIYPLIDSTAVLLKKKIKKQSNLKPFPGKIFLPKHLYSPGRPSTLATPGGRKEPEAPESLGTSAAPCGSRLSTSLSPIKPMDFATHFMKLNSPPGSSLKSSLKKRKRSLLRVEDREDSDAEEKKEENEDEAMVAPPRRQSVLGTARPVTRTYADDSSDSESETLLPGSASSRSNASQSREPTSAASSLDAPGSRQAIADTIVEEQEEEESEAPAKKRTRSKGTAAEVVDYDKVRNVLSTQASKLEINSHDVCMCSHDFGQLDDATRPRDSNQTA
ncbi:HAD-like domain [Phytophthora cactorum]|nr:HAD-like domain [Phytophthora cactorum]